MIFKPKALSMAMVAICSAGSCRCRWLRYYSDAKRMMFEKGNYASVSVVNVSPDVTGSSIAPTGSMYKDYSANTFAFKDRHDKMSLALPIICQLVSMWIMRTQVIRAALLMLMLTYQ